jgi:DNA mismatch endonuclease (patch repair protein)
MGRIRGKDTGPERFVDRFLTSHRFKFERHANDLPGRPDFVFRSRRIAVFVDGDFWHGWRFPTWSHKLSPFWRDKINANRRRDARNLRRLRRDGWLVVRIWEHQIDRQAVEVGERLLSILRERSIDRPSRRADQR